MKQILPFAFLFISIFVSQAQVLSDFEGLLTEQDTFRNGSQGEAGYSNGPAFYPTNFDFGFWLGGWSISNVTDTNTSGFENLYGVKAGSGQDSETFAVGQQGARINVLSDLTVNPIEGLYITNTTYAYNSMRDGDDFAKKFGGDSGDDPDFFKLVIQGYTNGELTADSVEFFLADFRFSDNSEDYLVDTWEWVALSDLGAVDSLEFRLSSSDNGVYGMNTPAFFCMDNLTMNLVSVFEKPQFLTAINVFPNPTNQELTIDLQSFDNELVTLEIFNLNGQLIRVFESSYSDFETINLADLNNGNYLLKVTAKDKVAVERITKL